MDGRHHKPLATCTQATGGSSADWDPHEELPKVGAGSLPALIPTSAY